MDAYRWYFLRAIAFGQDGSFSWEDFSARYTSELANDYGNLASRVAAMVGKYFGGDAAGGDGAGEAEQAIADGLAKAVGRGRPADRRQARLRRRHRRDLRLHQAGQRLPHRAGAVEGRQGRRRRRPRPGSATILYTAAEALRASRCCSTR